MTALVNQLRAELERFWPGPLQLFSHLHSQISLAFLERCPSPADTHGLGEARLAAFLVRERYSGKQTPAQLLAKLRRAPAGRVGEHELATRRQLVLTLVSMIKLAGEQITELERQIAAQVREHPDGQAFHTLADSTRHWHPWAQDLYTQARARGDDHPRALRTLGRAWSRVVWRCWQDRVPYDPAHHRALQRHITVTMPTTSGPLPDLAATQRMPGAAVTLPGRPARAKRAALDNKPPSATPRQGLTQDVSGSPVGRSGTPRLDSRAATRRKPCERCLGNSSRGRSAATGIERSQRRAPCIGPSHRRQRVAQRQRDDASVRGLRDPLAREWPVHPGSVHLAGGDGVE